MKKDFKMKIIYRFFILISVIVISSINLNAQTKESRNWVGAYTFTDSAQSTKRRNSYDVVPMIEYIITVKKSRNNQLTATFEVNGMQMFEVYQCSVKETGNKLNFYFQSGGIPDSGAENPQNFKKGALLFNLMETKVGAKNKYQFQAADYKPVRLSPKRNRQSIYFQKGKQ